MAYLAHREGSILQVTRQSTELESEDHLNNGEVHLPAHVVDVEPINMARGHVPFLMRQGRGEQAE
jgi:hypothetical protein